MYSLEPNGNKKRASFSVGLPIFYLRKCFHETRNVRRFYLNILKDKS